MKLLTRIMNGLGLGSFVYLFVTFFEKTQPVLTKETIGSIFLISACAGVLSILFDGERFSFIVALLLHFTGINLVVWACSFFNSWMEGIGWTGYLGSMFLFYSCSWLLFLLRNIIIAREMNQWIKRSSLLDPLRRNGDKRE